MLANNRAFSTGSASFFTGLKTLIYADRWLYLAIAAYCVAGSLFLLNFSLFDWASFDIYPRKWFYLFAVLMPIVALLCDAFYVIHRFDHRRRLVFKRMFSPARLAYLTAGVLCLMALSLFQSVFTALKTALPIIRGGFPYDEIHAAVDRSIHFNTDPWRLLQPFLGYDSVRHLIEWNYNVLWFVFCFATLFFMMTSPKAAKLRSRYLLCFCLIWIVLGTLVAGLFLSAGPAYFGFVTGDTQRFADQIAFLARGSDRLHSAASYQHYLWAIYSEKSLDFGSGISAFPSVHVGLITLTALFIAEMKRKLAVVLASYVALVMVSSVYLGWHYAIDGYVSVVVTLLIYASINKIAAIIEARRLAVMTPDNGGVIPA